jgi:hypothetical protein
MRFPYGVSDFYKLIVEEYLYIDRTGAIPLLEQAGDALLFLRPRRFGKSLLLSMLENYYDVNKADEFERLFGHLAIGVNPTPLHNRYLVMRWDFSGVAPRLDVDAMVQSIHNHINGCFEIFLSRYRDLFSEPVELHPTDAMRSFHSILAAVRQTPYKLYLLIDEYDNFANEVLMGGQSRSQQRYEALVFGEGEFKTVFKNVKSALGGLGLDRVFIVGVSPIVMHDVTSGFNIAENIYLRDDFSTLCGFTEAETDAMARRVLADCHFLQENANEVIELLRLFYNGSCFRLDRQESIYNPTALFYFLKHFQRTCEYPRRLLDSNLAPDHQKVAYIAGLPNGAQLMMGALDDANPLAVDELQERFGLHQMLADTKTTAFMASLLYYLGVLTLGGLTEHGEIRLRIPNLVIHGLYATQLSEFLLPDASDRDAGLKAAEALYQRGDPQPLCSFIEQRIFPVFDNRDYVQANELTVKTAFLTQLFNDTFYIMDSEPALERTYADLTMILRPEMRRFQLLDILIEFKFVKLGALEQRGADVRQMTSAALLALAPVQEKVNDAAPQLLRYGDTLSRKYGDRLRLRMYTVIAIGFERLVWVEV